MLGHHYVRSGHVRSAGQVRSGQVRNRSGQDRSSEVRSCQSWSQVMSCQVRTRSCLVWKFQIMVMSEQVRSSHIQ